MPQDETKEPNQSSQPPESLAGGQWEEHLENLAQKAQQGREAKHDSGKEIPPLPKYQSKYEPADFPRGFWRRVDYMLQHPENILAAFRLDVNLWKMSQIFLMISIMMSAIYGATMGSTNLLQGSELPLQFELAMIGITAIKVPLLFLLTLFIVGPPIYVSNTFMGARLPLRKIAALALASTAVACTILASMATVAFFFSLTSRSYHFIKLLHVAFFAYAGTVGLLWLLKNMESISVAVERKTPKILLLGWLLLYMFVGTQLAWVLRPFVGSPNLEFSLFRERKGNFYESVIQSFDLMQQEDADKKK